MRFTGWISQRVPRKILVGLVVLPATVVVLLAPARVAFAVMFSVTAAGLAALGLMLAGIQRRMVGQSQMQVQHEKDLHELSGQHERLASQYERLKLPKPPSQRKPFAERTILKANSVVGDDRARLAAINQLYLRAGYAPLEMTDTQEPLTIGGIRTATSGHVEQGPMVSVIMPAYNGETTVSYAIRSVLAQTWRHIELIVVDDASDDATAKIVASFADDDPRVHLVQQPTNSGAFAARNAGLKAARGELVTTHDTDDVAHAQMIEAQMQPLLSDHELSGSMAYCSRVNESLIFVKAPWNSVYLKAGYVTLLCRRSVFDDIGTWDDGVVGGADTEFIERVRAYYGDDAVAAIGQDVPMLLALQRDGSLTNNSTTGIGSIYSAVGARSLYREAYRAWHRSDSFRGDLPWDSDARPRPYPCPPAIRRQHLHLSQ